MLRGVILRHSVKFNQSVTKAGRVLDWSVDLRELLYSPAHLKLMSELLWRRVRSLKPNYIGGMTLSAEQLIGGIARAALEEGVHLSGFSMRPIAKSYGMRKRVEGNCPHPGARVLIVDDLVDSAQTVREVAEQISSLGATSVGIAVILDFQNESARKRLPGLPIFSLFSLEALGISCRPAYERSPLWRVGPLNTSGYTAPHSTPLIDDDGIVAAGDKGVIAAFDSSGRTKWRFEIKRSEHGIRTVVIPYEKSVVFGGYDGVVYRLDRETGSVIWTVSMGGAVAASPAVDVAQDVGYFAVNHAASGCDFLALKLGDGGTVWRVKGHDYSFARPALAGIDSVVFAANDGRIQCRSRSHGGLIWETRLPAPVKGWIIVRETRCFMGCFDGRLYSLDVRTGQILWFKKLADWLLIHPAAVGDKLLVSASGHLCCLSQEHGVLIWMAPTNGRFVGVGLDLNRNIALLGSDRGTFLCIDVSSGQRLWQYQAKEAFRCTPGIGREICAAPNYDGGLYVFSLDRGP